MPRPVASTPHLVWAAGHFFTLLAGLRYLLGTITFATSGGGLSAWYRIAYLGAIVSYGVVVYKSFGVPQANKAYIQRALMDENVQYLFLALYWWFTQPIFITLVPYTTFSLFHVLTFTRTTVIPMVFPTSPAASRAEGASEPIGFPTKVSKMIQGWVKQNYDPAMRFVAYSEVLVFARVTFGAILLRNSLLAPLFYAHFCRLRFYMSSFTRDAFQHVSSELDKATANPSCPELVRRAYLMGTDLISRYASTVLNLQNQAAPAAGGTRPAAAGGATAQ
ncbi:hypothetical protein IE81DRAFT_321634 [Ceraceosorus guamensis]|uniref:Endoplasmic reticulum protein n=1 Tax=Ceraceosorus guamensis TaxID=1522189 RepID=A0A316W3D5_9BASI|nr:hypothetical protein IE81DRAFT_321634 [Ceraceosorus guamensis]PWN44232.1 hypothetical protein IE81DRAFT_321634 [Ceraceosorus guamensis]